tara:strand:- start:1682 stop:2347 length:666 start_codon:yes stop_codon:yes gene_type:complete
MIKKLSDYKSIIFDCDGVILDSNKIKTNAFYSVAKEYNEQAAIELIAFHKANGGISRYKKFDLFRKELLPKYKINKEVNLDKLINEYSIEVKNGLLNCLICSDLNFLKKSTKNIPWSVVSGGDEKEIRYIFKKRNIDYFFEGGIYGSPNTKEDIFKKCLEKGTFKNPALYIGDSKYDYISASKFNIDFVFLSIWTEFREWKEYTSLKNIFTINKISDLINN